MDRLYYILNEDGTTSHVSLEEWGRWFQTADRHIGDYRREGYRVSTVFLGLDHNWGGGPPLIFETMTFDDTREVRKLGNRLYRLIGEELGMARYSTKDDALLGHARYVRELDRMLDAAKAATETLSKNPIEK